MTKDEKRLYDQRRFVAIRADPVVYERRKAQVRIAARNYYHRNPAKQIKKTAVWRARNPGKRKAQKLRHYRKHRDTIIVKQRARHWADRENNCAQSRAWYRANREYAKARSLEWRRANGARVTHYANKRRLEKTKNGGTHSLAQWQERVAQFGGCCFYCGQRKPLTRDHVIPVSRGGSDDIGNIVPACRPCNAAKGTLAADELFERRAK